MCFSDEETRFGQVAEARPFGVAEALRAARVVWMETGLPFDVVRVGLVLDLRPGALAPTRLHLSRAVGLTLEETAAAECIWVLQGEERRLETVARAVRHIRETRERYRRVRGLPFLRGKDL